MLRTLREGQDLLKVEVESLSETHPLDARQLTRIHNSAVEFASQAKSLIALMEEEAADGALIKEASAYCNFFTSIVAHTFFGSPTGRKW